MTFKEIEALVLEHGGTISPGINWTWAIFPDDNNGKKVFDQVKDHVEHRGYYDAQPEADLPQWGPYCPYPKQMGDEGPVVVLEETGAAQGGFRFR